MEDDLKKKMKMTYKKNHLFSIPLEFRGKPFLGLNQLSKIFISFLRPSDLTGVST